MRALEHLLQRPVATCLLTLALILAGAVALLRMPIASLPQVDMPTISVQASLPGAGPEVMAATVATPLERSLGRIAGVTEMTSSSSQGATRISLQFELGKDVETAAREVQAAINAARTMLPPDMPGVPTYRKVNLASAPVVAIGLTSPTHTREQLYDVAFTLLGQKIAQVPGVGQINVNGSSLPAVRVEVNPTALSHYRIGLEEVRAALAGANLNRPKGALENDRRQWLIEVNDRAHRAADFQDLIIAWRNGAPVRLGEVAQVRDSLQDLRNAGTANGQPAVMLSVFNQPDANVVATVDAIVALLPQLRDAIPADIQVKVNMDRSTTVRATLAEIRHTLLISIVLVILVVHLFLRSGRATAIPLLAIPASLLGSLMVIHLLGYSLNNLSLMALIIATGFVVDDAIVVVENTARHLQQGMRPLPAALRSIREVGFTVLAMTLALLAVFIPVLFMGGIVGRLLQEFVVTLAVAVAISLVVSLTTTPVLCAQLLRPHVPARPSRTEALLEQLTRSYRRSLGWALDHRGAMLSLLLAAVCLNLYLLGSLPRGFFPHQDTGRLQGAFQTDQGLSFGALRDKVERLMAIVSQDPDIDTFYEYTGQGGGNMMFARLKPRDERQASAAEIVARLRPKLASVPGATLLLTPQQDINVGGRQGSALYQYTLYASDFDDLRRWAPRLHDALRKLPQLTDVASDWQESGLQTRLHIDRAAATRLGVSARQLDTTLGDAFGQRLVSILHEPLNQYHVVLGLDPDFTRDAQALRHLRIASDNGSMVPLAAFARFETTRAPLLVNHQDQFAASTLSFNLAPGVSLGEAANAVNAAFSALAPPASVRGGLAGTAQVFQASLDNQPWLVLAALLSAYLVLGMLYESTLHPLTILSTLPSATVGALLALWASGSELSLIALIGLLLLIGIVMKNAIMMIDFALMLEREQGLCPRAAIHQAGVLRLRSILMTTLAAALGALPLALALGDGSELRRPLGITIVGGLLIGQWLTLYTTPVVYLTLQRLRLALARRRASAPLPD
ncbi:efflux RND transporter permease subunit [Pseudomonas sp. CR3202]|uniref:efflux RND transporter permease subunit n=1 Tax=Pseudomonas sp. CR3202 TaxID=3351532 RepID=UPI003BF402CE